MNLENTSLENLLNHLEIGVFRSARDEPGRILEANEALARMLGFDSASSLIGQPVRRFYVNLDDRSKYVEALRIHGAVENWPLHLTRVDGSRLEVVCCSRAVLDESGEFEMIEGILLDQQSVNRERLMRDAMMRLSKKLSRKLTMREVGRMIAMETRRLFEHDAFTLAVYDQESRSTLTYVYSEDTPLGGHEPMEYDAGTLAWPSLNSRPQLINREPSDSNAVTRFVPFGAEERRSMSLMFAPMKYQDILVGVLSVQSYIPHRYSRDNLDELVWLGNECAGAIERVIAEESLLQQELELRLLLNTSPFMTVMLDEQGIILDANEQMCRQLERTLPEIIGTIYYKYLPGEMGHDCRQLVDQVFNFHDKAVYEKCHEGRTYHVECHLLPQLNGSETMAALFVQDITEIRRNERLAALGMTASSLAHYIKNVQMSLNNSIKYLDEQLMQVPNDRIQRMWPVAKRAVRRVDQLVMDILNLSRDREPDMQPTRVNVFLNGLVEEYRPNANANGIELVFEPAMEDLLICIDHVQFWDVMLNLIANAIDAIGETRRTDGQIVLCAGRDDEQERMAWIGVSDNGPGLKPGVKERIFDAFFTTKGGQGTGLGLPVAKKIVEGHQGEIQVYSVPNVGMTFKILLPLADGGETGEIAE